MAVRFETGSIRPRGILEVEVDGIKLSGNDVPSMFRTYLRRHRDAPLAVDWEKKIWLALEARYPDYIKRKKAKGRLLMSVATARDFVAFTLKLIHGKKLESTQVALTRARICAGCPKQTAVVGCGKCVAAMKQLVHPPEKIPEIEALKACEACGCWMPLKVWVPGRLLAPMAGNHPYPGNCWMHQLPSSPSRAPSGA